MLFTRGAAPEPKLLTKAVVAIHSELLVFIGVGAHAKVVKVGESTGALVESIG